MAVGLLRTVICLAAAWAVVPGIANADEAKDVKPMARVNDNERTGRIGPIHLDKQGVVIRNAEELVARSANAGAKKDPKVQMEMEADVAKLLKVDAIDWKKQMVVGIVCTELESVKSDGKVLAVGFIPYNEPATRAIPRTPKVLLLLERFEGDVKFEIKKK